MSSVRTGEYKRISNLEKIQKGMRLLQILSKIVLVYAIVGAVISTHTPREGRDASVADLRYTVCISTHTPREGRDISATSALVAYSLLFQLTRPARGATFSMTARPFANVFQLTRPARGATP